jgi:hypothetical protein
MKITIKKILEDAKFTVEQHSLFKDKLLESIENKNPEAILSFVEENLTEINEESYIAFCEAMVEKVNEGMVLEEGEEVGEVSNTADPEGASATHVAILNLLKPLKEKNSEFDYQILDSNFGDDAYVVTIRQYDEERLDTFIVNGSEGHTMGDFKSWLEGKAQLYLGGAVTGQTFDDGLQVGQKAFPDAPVLTKEELETDYGKGIMEGFNRAKKDKEHTDPETYAEPLNGKVKPVTGDEDTVSDNPDKKKTPLSTKESVDDDKDNEDDDKDNDDKKSKKKIVKESVKRPEGVEEADYKKGYDAGHKDKMNGEDPSVTDEDESGYGKGYRRGYKDANDYKTSNESINYDEQINEKINSSLSTNIVEYLSEKSLDVMKGDNLSGVLSTIKEDIKPYTTETRYAYIMERFVENLAKYGLNVYFVKEEKTLTQEELNYINDETLEEGAMKTKNYPAKGTEPKGKEKEPKDPNFGGANTTISDDMYKDFAEKNKHKVMTYSEAKAVFEKMFNIKIVPEGEESFKAKINNEIVLNGEGKSVDTVSDNAYRIFKERSNAMAWADAKDGYEKMFNIKLMPEGEEKFKSMLNNDDLLAGSDKSDTTVSDKVSDIGDHVDGKSKAQVNVKEDIDELKDALAIMTKNMSVLTESMSTLINKSSEESIKKIKEDIIEEAVKDMNDANKIRFEKLSNALVFESADTFKETIESMKKMIVVEEGKKDAGVFADEKVYMSDLERKYR